MKYLTLLIICFSVQTTFAQVKDIDIVNSLLFSERMDIKAILNGLDVQYAIHYSKNSTDLKDYDRVIATIADEDGTAKVFILDMNKKRGLYYIDRIFIKYQHDDLDQVQDRDKIEQYARIKIGTYSSTVIFE